MCGIYSTNNFNSFLPVTNRVFIIQQGKLLERAGHKAMGLKLVRVVIAKLLDSGQGQDLRGMIARLRHMDEGSGPDSPVYDFPPFVCNLWYHAYVPV